MHELSIASAVVETAVGHAAGRRVMRVALRVGALRQVVPGSLGFYFEIAARGTHCAGARLDVEHVAARLRCRECGREWDPAPDAAAPSFRCICGAAGTDVVNGDELEVESIEVNEEDACIAPG